MEDLMNMDFSKKNPRIIAAVLMLFILKNDNAFGLIVLECV
jgi:hypothetical protein